MSVGILKPGTAIPTAFKGITYRSRLEANVAQFLYDLGLKFEYESDSFLIDGSHYAPDFYLPDVDRYVEVRGYVTETSEAILEGFAKQRGDLFVFYSDKAEHLEYLRDQDEVFRWGLTATICDDSHASLATLGRSLRGDGSPCWFCRTYGHDNYRHLAQMEVVMRSGVPVLVTEVGKTIQGLDSRG